MADEDHKKFDKQTDNHPKGGKGYGCVWKHAAEIKQSEWDSHPCHYPTQGTKAIVTHRARYEKEHRDRAVGFGYLRRKGNKYEIASRAALAALREKADERAAKDKKGEFSRKQFMARHSPRHTEPLEWLVREEDGWYVQHQHPDLSFVKTFTLKRSSSHPGQQYPYHHEHHHIIPEDALNKFVLDAPVPSGGAASRDGRITVLLKAKWNLNHENNMVVLPSEVVPARVVGLPAHCPWDEADHPKYTDSLELWLKDASQLIDSKITAKKHAIIAQASDKLTKVSNDLREVIFQKRGGLKLMAARAPKPGEA